MTARCLPSAEGEHHPGEQQALHALMTARRLSSHGPESPVLESRL